jgi:bacterioferritin-associated ferredoxin
MNKAFCKEPDTSVPPRCPACGNEGLQVSAETLHAHAAPADAAALGEPAFWCGTDRCDVAYFDLLERTIGVAAARGLHWPKDPAGPLCACHGLTVDDVDRDIAEGTPTRVREVVRKAAEPAAACAAVTADGRPCVARVQRHYLRRRQELGG